MKFPPAKCNRKIMMIIPEKIFDEVVAHARGEAPLEACGYLAGNAERVEKQVSMTNIDAAENHFRMDPMEQLKTVKAMRAEGLDLIGCWHSHPQTDPEPSAEDIRLAFDPVLFYAIVSLKEPKPEIRAFRIESGAVNPVTINVI